jgi:hypothetical protein
MKSLYLAAQFERQQEIKAYAEQLAKLGYTITSSWLHEEASDALIPLDSEKAARYAQNDIDDVKAAEGMVAFTPLGHSRGGMHVEFGMAIAWDKELIVVGPKPTLFHHMRRVRSFATWPEALKFLSNGYSHQ